MLAIQRGEGRVADAERERACGWREREEERGVDNGLDKERVDVVVDDRAPTRTQTNNRNGHGNPETIIKHCIGCSSGTQTGNR